MPALTTLILPGLDGTGDLLERFRDLAPASHDATVLTLPRDGDNTYRGLMAHFAKDVVQPSRCLLIGESFSGPLAVMLAAAHPDVVAGVVLVASFVTSPAPRFARFIPWSLVCHLPVPRLMIRHSLLGHDAPRETVDKVRRAIASVPARTLAQRMQQALAVDVSEVFKRMPCPALYLRATQDAVVSYRCVDAIVRARGDTVVRDIPGPHLLLQQQPQQAWRHIGGFIP